MDAEPGYPLRIQKDGSVPIYRQLANQIRRLVSSGYWPEGTKLPTEREMAYALGISRNTVSVAYRELEASGILVSYQGKGTFVAASPGARSKVGQVTKAVRLLERSIDEALLAGVSVDKFLRMAEDLIRQRQQALSEVRVAFVECNREQLDYFSKELELGAGVHILPLLLEDLERGSPGAKEGMLSADLVVTTFFHQERVKQILESWGSKAEVLSIALDPQMDTMVTIARVDRGKKIGMVCLTKAFAERVRKSLEQAGIDLDLKVSVAKDEDALKEFLSDLDVVLTSPGRRKEVERLAKPSTQVIEFIYRPDAGSVNLLRMALLRKKKDFSRVAGDRSRPYLAGM